MAPAVEIPDDDEVCGAQRKLVAGVATALDAVGVTFDLELERSSVEPWYRFTLHLPLEPDLSVRIYVAFDTFEIEANGADLRCDIQDAENDASQWVGQSLAILTAILGSELRLRVRRTLSGRATGAIWVPQAEGGVWNGDLFAALGVGRIRVFRPWPTLQEGRAG